MVLDLKYYSETTISAAKNLNNSINKDFNFSQKYEILKLLEAKYRAKKIFYSKSFNSFIIIFNTEKDESDVYKYLAKLKKGYYGIQLLLDLEYNKDENVFDYILKIEY